MSPSSGLAFFISPLPPFPPLCTQLLMRQFAGARQTQPGTARLCPGAKRWERANRATWHLRCKHVACWRAKSLVGGLYLFFKELVRFIYTRHRLHVLEERGETHSLSAGSPASPAAAAPWDQRSREQENTSSWLSPGSSSRSKGQQEKVLQPPSSASLRNTTSAFKQRKCQVLPAQYIFVLLFLKSSFFFFLGSRGGRPSY